MLSLATLSLAGEPESSTMALPSVRTASLTAEQLEWLRSQCAEHSFWAEVSGRLYCPSPLAGAGEAVLERRGMRLVSDPASAHYRLARGKLLPQELRAARVGGDADTHLLYLPPHLGASELERIAKAEAAEAGSRAFAGELLSLERRANKVLKGSWQSEASLSGESRRFAEAVVAGVSKERLRTTLEELVAHESRHASSASYPDMVDYVGRTMQQAGLEMLPDYAAPAHGGSDDSWGVEEDGERAPQHEGEGRSVHRGPCVSGDTGCWNHHNVVGRLAGSDPALPPMLIAAHMDDLPAHGRAPGAEDNGSGVAVLLEMARVLGHFAQQSRALERGGGGEKAWPERTILFAGFGGEEGAAG